MEPQSPPASGPSTCFGHSQYVFPTTGQLQNSSKRSHYELTTICHNYVTTICSTTNRSTTNCSTTARIRGYVNLSPKMAVCHALFLRCSHKVMLRSPCALQGQA